MSYRLEFKLMGLPKTTNANIGSWRARHGRAKKWKDAVVLATKGKAPANPLSRARLTLTRHSSVEPDFDGLVSSFKHVIDGLTEAGIIRDDKMSVIGQPTYFWQVTGRGSGFITVVVESAEEKAA